MLTPLDDPAWDDLQAALDDWHDTKAGWIADGKWPADQKGSEPQGVAVHLEPAAPAAPARRLPKLRPEIVNPVPRRQRVARRNPYPFGFGTRGRPPKKKPNGHAQARGP